MLKIDSLLAKDTQMKDKSNNERKAILLVLVKKEVAPTKKELRLVHTFLLMLKHFLSTLSLSLSS